MSYLVRYVNKSLGMKDSLWKELSFSIRENDI